MIRSLSKTNRQALIIGLVAPAIIMVASYGTAFDKVNKTSFGVAIKGYDTVAYHTENRAVKGKSEVSYNWNDAVWYFATAENRNLFAADPERYAPQYGGYCARSLSTTGKVFGADPEVFKIIDGKLFLSWNTDTANQFQADASASIPKADARWKELIQQQ